MRWKMTRRLFPLMMFFALIISACNGGSPPANTTPTPTPDPLVLVMEAAENIRAAETFRLNVSQTGPDYAILTDYGSVIFRRADAQYVAPGVMQAAVRVGALGLTIDIDVFARGADQWFRAIWTGNSWLHAAFSPGFNPEALIAEETGFQAAVDSVTALTYVGETALENGRQVLHIRGTADGASMNALLIGLIQMVGEVGVEVYIDAETRFPVRFVLTETTFLPDLATAESVAGDAARGSVESPSALGAVLDAASDAAAEPAAQNTALVEGEPRVWTMDILDIDVPASLDEPAAEATAEVTPEMTTVAEATTEAGS